MITTGNLLLRGESNTVNIYLKDNCILGRSTKLLWLVRRLFILFSQEDGLYQFLPLVSEPQVLLCSNAAHSFPKPACQLAIYQVLLMGGTRGIGRWEE